MLHFGASRDTLDEKIHAHNTSVVFNQLNDTYYVFYCAVGVKGRLICLVADKPLR